MIRNFTLAVFLLLMAFQLQAHSIWIETASKGSIGKEQVVKVFFGVFDKNEREKIKDSATRWTEVDKFTAWTISPSGKKALLKFVPGVDSYNSAFTPTEKGTYVVVLENKLREVADWTETKAKIGIVKQNFYSRTSVVVDKAGKSSENAISDLSIIKEDESNFGPDLAMKVIYKGKPVVAAKVLLRFFGRDDLEAVTDKEGKVSFKQLKPGYYFVLALLRFDTPGTYNGVAYAAIREKATLTAEIK